MCDKKVITVSFGCNNRLGETSKVDDKFDHTRTIAHFTKTPSQTNGNNMNNLSKELLYEYLNKLVTGGVISLFEEKKISLAITPLLELFPTLNTEDIEKVREEMRGEGTPHKHQIAQSEESLWKKSIANGKIPIKGFDLTTSLAHFESKNSKDWGSRVTFLRPSFRKEVPVVKVPTKLRNGRIIFLLILKMFRLHAEVQQKQSERNERTYNELTGLKDLTRFE